MASPQKSSRPALLKREDICRRIAMLLLPKPDDMVLEIGPGPGALTRAIEEQPHARLLLLEKDNHWAAERQRLGEVCTQAVLTDALRFDWRRITPNPWKIIGNLPYNVASLLIWDIGFACHGLEACGIHGAKRGGPEAGRATQHQPLWRAFCMGCLHIFLLI